MGRTGSTPRPRRCAGTSRASRPARRRASRPRRRKARRAASRSSSTGPPAGAASSGSSPVWRPAEGPDTRFIVTNLKVRNARVLYEDVYCRRSQAENHIKSWKTHLAADRTSGTKATANQLRLFLHAGAYWLMGSARVDAQALDVARRAVRYVAP